MGLEVKPARTCIQTMPDGHQCGSLALRGSPRCYYHHPHRRHLKRHIVRADVSTIEGRIQTIERVYQALIKHEVDYRIAHGMLQAVVSAEKLDRLARRKP